MIRPTMSSASIRCAIMDGTTASTMIVAIFDRTAPDRDRRDRRGTDDGPNHT